MHEMFMPVKLLQIPAYNFLWDGEFGLSRL